MNNRMKWLYVEALFKNEDNEYYVAHCKSYRKDMLKEECIQLERMGYKPIKAIITNDRVMSLSARLKFHLIEFRSLKADINYYGYDEMLINRIGSLTSRLLTCGIDITDEVALQCYDIRQKIIEENKYNDDQEEEVFIQVEEF